jgi:hypothetical protein
MPKGLSCSARHSFLPITKGLIGELAARGQIASHEFSSNHGRLTPRLCRLKFPAFVLSGKVISLAPVRSWSDNQAAASHSGLISIA